MPNATLISADNQAVQSRFGTAVWLTDYVTPQNPEVMLTCQAITRNQLDTFQKIRSCWRYIASIPYTETVKASLNIEGMARKESDVWLFPAETIKLAPMANCANKSFALASLLRTFLEEDRVYCALGHLHMGNVGAHAWVVARPNGQEYIVESTVSDEAAGLVPVENAPEYRPVIYFNDTVVYTVGEGAGDIIQEHFGFCAVPWLGQYLCERCSNLEV